MKIRGSLDNRERKLKGEMFVTADLETQSKASLQVPEKAVLAAGGRNYVFIEEAPGTTPAPRSSSMEFMTA